MKAREACPYCKKYHLYETNHQIFLPPTILMENLSRDGPKFYHDTCVIRNLKKYDNRGHPYNNSQRHAEQ